MLTYIRPFQFYDQATLALAVTAVNQTITLNPNPNPDTSKAIRVAVSGSQTVYISFVGAATVPASGGAAGSIAILPGFVETFWLPAGVSTVNVIAGAVGSTVFVTPGEGA